MLSKNKIKYLRQLSDKKFRRSSGEFLVEGDKVFQAAIQQKWNIKEVYVSENYFLKHEIEISAFPFEICSENQLKQIGNLESNQSVAALVEQKNACFSQYAWENSVSLVLDNIKDPGNLGTIIRTADWFGIKHIICSLECVDLYNPKVIQASMGSFFSSHVYHENLSELFNKAATVEGFPIFGAYLNGEAPKVLNNIKKGFLVLGSESHGISENLEPFITQKITIPSSPISTAESLNVGIACGILCYALNLSSE